MNPIGLNFDVMESETRIGSEMWLMIARVTKLADWARSRRHASDPATAEKMQTLCSAYCRISDQLGGLCDEYGVDKYPDEV